MKSQLKLLLMTKSKHQSVKMINRSTLNKSPSKQLVFFTKAKRFPEKKHTISQEKEFRKESRSHSSCSSARIHKFPTIPQAQRILYFDQEKQLCLHPSPQAYNVKSEEEMFKVTHRGGTMGARFNSIPNLRQVTPSAVDYKKQNIPIKKSFNKSFTFDRSQRNLMTILTKQGKDSPGPKYDIQNKLKCRQTLPNFQVQEQIKQRKNITKITKLKIANNPNNNRFSTVHLQKIDDKKAEYKLNQNTQRGRSVKRNVGFSTTRRHRLHTLPQKNPGPGSYVFFSQFSGWM